MKIGIIVEGQGEVLALKTLLPKITTTNQFINSPLRADLQPKASTQIIARSAHAVVAIFQKRAVEKIVVLIDREDRERPETFCRELKQAFLSMYKGIDFEIVIKNRQIENWLLADIDALKANNGRFNVTENIKRAVQPNKADNISKPCNLLETACIKKSYHKGNDPKIIMEKQCPRRVALHSRSFRRFLRVIGDPQYSTQSKNP